MKSFSLRQRTFTVKTLFAGTAVLALAASIAPANITFDLRASATDPGVGVISGDGKLITLGGTTGTVTLQIWAQVTNAAPTSNIFGVQSILGSIVSTSSSPSLLAGTMSPSVPMIPFNAINSPGAVTELTAPPDGILDLGSNATTANTSYIRFRKDPLSQGTQVGNVFYASNLDPAGATSAPITNGFEFLMGTATLSISSFVNTSGTASLNWRIPPFVAPANRAQIAQWTDGDGVSNSGITQFAEMFVGSPVSFLLAGSQASTWIASGGGSWAASPNWDNGAPNDSFITANLSGAITAPSTVTLDGNKIVNTLNFASANAYIIAAGTGGALSVTSAINDVSGSHTIAVPVNLAGGPATVNVSNAADTLTISGAIAGTSRLTKTGAGRLLLTGINTFANDFVINAGIVDLNASGGNALADATEVNGGTLRLLQSNQISDNASLVVQGGTFDLGANSETVRVLQLLSGSVASAGGTLTSLEGYIVQSGTISANLAGSTGLTKEMPGTVTLTGANTFTGLTTVSGGVLNLNTTGATVIAGNVLIQGGTLRLLQSNQIADTSAVSVESGEFALGNQSEIVASVLLAGGSITGTGGTLTSLSAFDLRSGAVSANLAGSVGLNKTTSGSVALSGTNTYTGGTTVTAGVLEIINSAALPANGPVMVAAGSALGLSGVPAVSVGPLNGAGSVTLAPSGDFTIGAGGGNGIFSGAISGNNAELIKIGPGFQNLTGDNTYTGPTTLLGGQLNLSGTTRSTVFTAQNGGRLSFGEMTVNLGFGSIRAEAGSRVEYAGATINGGFLRGPGIHEIEFDDEDFGPTTFNGVTTFSGTQVLFDGGNGGVAALVNFTNGGVVFNESGTLTWDGGINTSSGLLYNEAEVNLIDWTNDGVIFNEDTINSSGSNLVSGGGSRIENLGQMNIETGRALVLQGSLLTNNGTITGATEIYFGARAQGSGVFGPVSVFEGGSFSPGNSPGTATINGRYTWGARGSFDFEIADARGTAGSVTGWDLVNVIGPDGFLVLDAGTTPNSRFTLRIASNDIDQALPALNFDSSSSYQWLIVDTSQGVTGFDPAEVALDTSRFVNPLNGGSFALATDGDKLFLNFNPVPEPSCAALLLAGAGLLGLRRRA